MKTWEMQEKQEIEFDTHVDFLCDVNAVLALHCSDHIGKVCQ